MGDFWFDKQSYRLRVELLRNVMVIKNSTVAQSRKLKEKFNKEAFVKIFY